MFLKNLFDGSVMGSLVFSVDSALLNELGEKLVETVHIALIELVKNAYDADSTEVAIRFIESESGGPEIHVVDNGTGMTFDEVKAYWMRIATTNKAEDNCSRIYGRPKTGSKGIGRFSCRRLGTRLRLDTIAKKEDENKKTIYEKTVVTFPWQKFKAGTEVTKISCPGSSEIIKEETTGTTLIISGNSNDEWNKRGYNYLKRQLAVLVANRGQRRPGYKEDPGFNIYLDVPRYEGKVKDLREELISAGWGTITAYVNKKHQAVCQLKAKGIGKKSITSQRKFEHLTGVSLKVGIIPENKGQMRDTSVLSKGTMRTFLPDWGGVQVRYKGFRVYPHGDDDWLDLDHDRGLRRGAVKNELSAFAQSLKGIDPKRTLLQLLSMRNHVGSVEINSTATEFEMKANREGFIKSPAVDELKLFVRFCIDWATVYRDYYIQNESKQKAEEAREELEEVIKGKIKPTQVVESAVNFIKDEIYRVSTHIPQSEKKKFEKTISKAAEVILSHDKTKKEELNQLRLLASTSSLLLIFSHEVKSLLGLLDGSSSLLKTIEKKLDKTDANAVRRIRKDLQDSKIRFNQLMDMTSLIGFRSKNSMPIRLALYERIKTAGRCFSLIIDSYDINLDYEDVPPNIMVKSILEAELYVIIINVLSNSIKSVIAAGGTKRIHISAKRDNGKTVILFKDTGLGIVEKYFKDVFIPFIADPDGRLYKNLNKRLNPEDKFIVGTGSGLGLGIVKEIVESKKGAIRFHKPKGIWKVKLEVVLP